MKYFFVFLGECWGAIATISIALILMTVGLIQYSKTCGIEILTIDGCEYIRDTRHAVSLVHKANCKNH